jgi:hypothetical protein
VERERERERLIASFIKRERKIIEAERGECPLLCQDI